MRRRRAEPRRREAPRWTAEEWVEKGHWLEFRAQGRCEFCGELRDRGDTERHHRMRRRDGGDRLANILLLHRRCHAWITEHPEAATRGGWIVPTWDDVLAVPVLIRGRRYVLTDDGDAIVIPG